MSVAPPITQPRRGSRPAARVARPGRLTARVSRAGVGFVTPFLVAFTLVFIAPLLYSVYLSLFRNQLVGGTQFVGLDNYAAVFVDPKFWDGALRVMLFLAVQVPIMLAIALVAALAIDSGRLHGRRFFRIGLFLPYAVPGVVAAMMWGFMYSDRVGLTGSLNDLAGFELLVPYTKQWLLVSIGNIVTWEFVGYNMLILYSALKTVPNETYEAAAIDGAGQFRIVRYIKLPAVRGALVIATVFSIIGSFQLFNEPQILKGIVPNLISTSYTPNIYAYTLSFQGNQVSYAATVAIVMGVITAGIAYLVQLRGMRRES